MRIAIVKHSEVKENNAYAVYLYSLLIEAAKEHHYEIIETGKSKIQSTSTDALFVIDNSANTQLGLKWFYEINLPVLIKKINADIIIQLNGCLSISIKQRQLMVLPALEELQNTEKKISATEQFLQKKFPSFLSKANGIITFSSAVKTSVAEREVDMKTTIIPVAAQDFFKPIEWEQKELLKAEYSGGSEFFIVCQDFYIQDELLSLLKAFSVFKKWQQSGMKLLIVGKLLFDEAKAQEKIATYKYRDDIKIITALSSPEYASLLAASYSYIHLSKDAVDIVPILQAMQSETSVIVPALKSHQSFFEETVLYNEDSDAQTVGNNMILIYKNEQLRNQLIGKAKEFVAGYKYQETGKCLWQLISNAVHDKMD